jgi:LAO/AO transport system kinase
MEIADIFVINKADLPGAGRTRISIETSVHESKAKDDNWLTPVIMTSSFKTQGIDELWNKVKEHYNHLNTSGELERRRFKNLNSEIIAILENKLKNYLELKLKENESLNIIQKAGEKQITSRIAADEIFKRL